MPLPATGWMLATILGVAALGACAHAEMTEKSPSFDPAELARQDLAKRLTIDIDEITVVAARQVTWSDGSLGCPQPDRMYTQALVPGVLIVLRAGDETFEYHGARGVAPFLCAPASRIRAPIGDGPPTS